MADGKARIRLESDRLESGHMAVIARRIYQQDRQRLEGMDDEALRAYLLMRIAPFHPDRAERDAVVNSIEDLLRRDARPADDVPVADDVEDYMYERARR